MHNYLVHGWTTDSVQTHHIILHPIFYTLQMFFFYRHFAFLSRSSWVTPDIKPGANVWWSHVLWKSILNHDEVIKWTHFPRYWPFVWWIHRSPVNSLRKHQWRGALMFSFICTWTNSWANNEDVGDLRRHYAHYDVIVMPLEGHRSKVTCITYLNFVQVHLTWRAVIYVSRF